MDDKALIAHVGAGGKVDADETLPPGYRGELMRLMVVFVDSELAGASGFVGQVNRGPGLKERMVAARIVSEKFGHADRVLALLAPFGVNPRLYVRSHAWDARLDREADLGVRRVGGDKRLNVFHYPLEGWNDAVVMNMLMGTASAAQLRELRECSYGPLAEAMGAIVPQESRHAQLGENGLREALERGASVNGVQALVDYWYPRVADTFGRTDSDRFDLYRRYGLRRHSNAELLAAWEGEIGDRLGRLGLTLPGDAGPAQ